MEILNEELDNLIEKLENSSDFKNDLDSVRSVYPFSRYEYVISTLLAKYILSYEEYLDLRDSYIDRNLYLSIFEISPRGFGDTWAFSHLLSVEPELKRPNKKSDATYKNQYDLYLPYNGNSIKIEVKASRAVDQDRADEPLSVKALSSGDKKSFLMNFQQVKPQCCDVFLWIAVYRDCVKYWVMKNKVIYTLNFAPQHRNVETESRAKDYRKEDIYEGQVMIKRDNIGSLDPYIVEGRGIRQAIIEQYES